MLKVAYIQNIVPTVSETFVEREINYLRKEKFRVYRYAVRNNKSFRLSINKLKNDKDINYFLNDLIILGPIFFVKYLFIKPKEIVFSINIILKEIKLVPIPQVFAQFIWMVCGITLVERLKKEGIDHIHAHFGHASSIALFAKIFNRKLIYTFTAHASADIFRTPILLKEKVEYANLIISISNYNKEYLNLVTDFQYQSKVVVVYNGVEIIENLSVNIQKYSSFQILSVGRFSYFKGFPTLLFSMKLLIDKGFNITLTIIGDGEQRFALEYLIKELHLEDCVQLTGELKHQNVLEKMEECNIFVLPSEIYVNGNRDGMPTVILEAMSYGKPIISTYVSGIPECILDNYNGFLIHEKNVEELSNSITKFYNNPKLSMSFGENGMKMIEEKFDIKKTIKELAKEFTKLHNDV